MSLYPDIIKNLQQYCILYRSKQISLEDFKSILWNSSQCITALEEKKLRGFLMRSEAELDSLQYTTDENFIHISSMQILSSIEQELKKWT